jgi:hypothetical protein
VICPSCGEFISTEDPKVCPFCRVDLENFAFPASRSYGVPKKGGPPPIWTPAAVPTQPGTAPEFSISGLDFRRSDGSPRRYIDKRLPRCPFCRSKEPQWEYAVVSGWLNRANFRCQKCMGVLSVPSDAFGSLRSASSLFGGLGLSEYLRVERVGKSPGMEGLAPKLIGGEFTLERLRTWADRSSDELPASAG